MSRYLDRSIKITLWIGALLLLLQGVLSFLAIDSPRTALAFSIIVLGSCLALCLITTRLKGEVARRAEAEEHASLLLESVWEGVLGVNQAGAISFVNKAALELLGYRSAQELLGRDAREALHRNSAQCPRCERDKCRIYPAFTAGKAQHSENELLLRKNGTSFNADFCCTPVLGRESGKLQGAVMTFRDTSKSKKALERLRLQSAALESAANSMLICDAKSRIIWVNEAFTRQTGYPRAEAIGENAIDLLSGRDDREELTPLRQTIIDKRSWHGELSSRRKDGTLYDEEVTITPVLDERGEITNFIGIMQDVSERRRSQEALQQGHLALQEANRRLRAAIGQAEEMALKAEKANAAKSEFLANMSHEIRTPMNAITGIAYLLGETPLSVQQQEFVRTLNSSAQTLLGIINDVLDFSKIEAGMLEIAGIDFTLGELVGEAVSVFTPKAAQKGIELRCELDPMIPPRLVGDPLRLTQILNNLLSNALKFTDRGSVTLSVSVLRQKGEGGELEFSVRDTGIGMRPEDQAQLFQAFTQVDGSITRNYGGTGLGLAICKRLTELMGGEIWCESRAGVGSTFLFRLPFAVGARTPLPRVSAAPAPPAPAAGTRFNGERVLLVEDNPFNQQVAVAILENVGLQVTVADDGARAVELVSRQEFDLVLMDIQMPVMDGLTAARRIRELERPGAARLPIVAVSANALEQDVKESIAAGMNAHISKPYMPADIYGTIAGVLAVPGKGRREAASLDSEAGMRQVGVSRSHYREVLAAFQQQYQGGAEDIRREMAADNRAAAARLVHSVKEMAGGMAAATLQSVAAALEAALETGSPCEDQLLCALERELADALERVREELRGA